MAHSYTLLIDAYVAYPSSWGYSGCDDYERLWTRGYGTYGVRYHIPECDTTGFTPLAMSLVGMLSRERHWESDTSSSPQISATNNVLTPKLPCTRARVWLLEWVSMIYFQR